MKTLRITVNGKTYDVQVEETNGTPAPASAPASAPVSAPAPAPAPAPTPAPAPAPAPVKAAPGAGEEIKCPMPGNILDVKISNGQSVKKGDVLIILEAMKMENEIMAPKDGTVTSVCVNKGDVVNPGQVLATLG